MSKGFGLGGGGREDEKASDAIEREALFCCSVVLFCPRPPSGCPERGAAWASPFPHAIQSIPSRGANGQNSHQ